MDISNQDILFAFGLTFFAGISTGIGSLISFYTKQTNKRFLSLALGFSAGVMLYVSMIEIFVKARESLEGVYGASQGYWLTTFAFFMGILLIIIIDKFIPSPELPDEIIDENNIDKDLVENSKLLRMGVFSALAIAIHNFPEGIATFIGAIQDPALGVSIAIAIAIHNIPEGIAVSVPIYYATGDRKKAFMYSFMSGLTEPVGALIGFFLLRNFLNDTVFGLIFAGVAGIMVYISIAELIPTANKYGDKKTTINGLIAGMAVMALSLLLVS